MERIHDWRRWVLGGGLAAVLVAAPAVLMAQTQGPLTIKIPPRRSGAERPTERDQPSRTRDNSVPQRASGTEYEPADNPCPSGYIAVPAPDSDERPPRLTRNPSSETEESDTVRTAVECVSTKTIADPGDRPGDRPAERRGGDETDGTFLDQVRKNVSELSANLPDLTCTQFTRRYENLPEGKGWRLIDRIQADVLIIDNEEQYRNIRRNGVPVDSPEKTGAWTSGEFGVWLQDVFLWQDDAGFKEAGTEEFHGVQARRYDFAVRQEDSHWLVTLESQSSELAFKGTAWIDPATRRVVRLAMQATDLPADYPLDKLEVSVDYGPVEIGGTEYMLPVESKNLSCARGTGACTSNTIEFHDYGKFTVDSSISTAETPAGQEGQK